MSLNDLPRLARTVVHLRPSQIVWRGRYVLRRRGLSHVLHGAHALPSPNGAAQPFTKLRASDIAGTLEPLELLDEQATLDRLSQGVFQHLNEQKRLGHPPDWILGARDRDRLWTVTLHYHRWAWELASIAAANGPCAERATEIFREFVNDWIERCDPSVPDARHLAWNSYAIATRLGWWAQSALCLSSRWWTANPGFADRFLASFWRQADHLVKNIEWDLRGNHLVRDAVGLAWAGRFFDGADARRWLRQASELALDQAAEQVLADGGHFERSPMYHVHVMRDLETIGQLIDDASLRERLAAVLGRMHEFARWARHPDGEVALLNDAGLGEESHPLSFPAPNAIEPRGGRYFANTGLAVWRGAKWTLFFDVGPIGPDYQPGHGHADNLTIECCYGGERLFVDPGAHSYDRDERRAYDRSTAAHNTVCVDDTDSSEVWHIFRAGRRARPFDVNVVADAPQFDASAAHDGYRHLGGVIHRRRILLADDETLTVTDCIEGNGSHKLEGGWLLAPGWTATAAESGWQLSREGRSVRVRLQGPSDLRLARETRPWHPRFGVEIPTTRLAWRWEGRLPFQLKTTIEPARA
jgi:uncharacterized heparinase superfamily protein